MIKQKENGVKISPMSEHTSRDGSGVVGFTVWTSDSKFNNLVEYFDPTNRSEVLNKMTSLRESYLHQAEVDEEQAINIQKKGD